MCMYVCSMRQIFNAIEKVWDRICDHSDAIEHYDSVLRWKVIRPIREAIYDYRESRRIAAIDHEVF